MHFSIPDIQQFHDDNGTSYTGYNIHIDGFFHCTARFKQLLSLHEQLHLQHPKLKLPSFPPKKFLPLTNSQLEERRASLEKYMQLIGQNGALSHSDLLITFLSSAQQETHCVRTHEVDIEVTLMNGYRIPLSISSTDNSDQVLDAACNHINLTKELIKYFSLYLINWSCAKNSQPALKKLEDYESPYISQKYVRPEDKIVLRKCYWDPGYDVDLMIDRVSLDLLYLQIISEIDLGWIIVNANTRERLVQYEENKQKREYIELARSLHHYSRIPAGEAIADGAKMLGPWTKEAGGGQQVRVALAAKELALSTLGHQPKEQRFKVTRMRCWRITTLHQEERYPSNGHDPATSSLEPTKHLELSFEYLLSKDHLEWVTLRTEHATYISVCLQSIVDELMRQKAGSGVGGGGSRSGTGRRLPLTYLRRDGSSQLVTPSSSTDTLSSGNGDSSVSTKQESFSIRMLSEKFASVAFKVGSDRVENDAFEGIGDDDL